MACNGDSTTLPKAFNELTGIATNAQLPSGSPVQLAIVNLTIQAANISTTTLYTPLITGFFRVTASLKRTQIATTSSTLPSLTIAWTEGDNSAAGSNVLIATNATNMLAAAIASQQVVWAKATTAITYATAGYASAGTTPMQYALRIKCEGL